MQCALQELTEDYWGESNPENPVQAIGTLLQIANMAAQNPNFGHGTTGDAQEFLTWLSNETQDITEPARILQQEALFAIDYSDTDVECRTCHHSYTVPNTTHSEWAVEVGFMPELHWDFSQILFDGFHPGLSRTCPNCRVVRQHFTCRRIESAPQILRVCVTINGNGNNGTFKWLNPFNIEEHIDLTDLQCNNSLPLQYTLSSVIAHGGPGGNTEHFLTTQESMQLFVFGQDPVVYDENILRLEQQETLRHLPRIVLPVGEGGYPARDMSPGALQHMADYNGLEEVTEEQFAEELGLEESSHDAGYLPRELPDDEIPQQPGYEDAPMSDSYASPSNDSQWPDNTVGNISSHYIINARGPNDVFHISDGHATAINRAHLANNPQRPNDVCQRVNGYQAYVMTYIRDPLRGKDKKLEDLIVA